MNEKHFVVFYAWQSDAPANINRSFIESAVEAAIKEVKKLGHIDRSPRLDKDTKDVSGIPDIANTILEKIRSADVFLGDLTYVARVFPKSEETTEDVIPNANVMIELGYALAELGWERIVTVINTHYGSPEKLPFDLKTRRWPIDYELSPDAKDDIRKEQKQKLVQKISGAINSIAGLPPRDKSQTLEQRIQTLETALQRKQEPEPDSRQRCAEHLDILIKRILAGKFEGMPPTSPKLVITILPGIPHSSLDIFGKNQEKLTTELQPLYAYGWDYRRYGDRLVTFSKPKETIDAVTEITHHGIINAAGDETFTGDWSGATKDTDVIPILSVESNVIETVGRYCRAIIDLRVRGPLVMGIAIINLHKSILRVGSWHSTYGSRVYEGDKIIPPPVEIPEDVDLLNTQAVAKALRPVFDFIWREYNYPRSLDYDSTGEWGDSHRR